VVVLGGVDDEFHLEFQAEPSLIPAVTVFNARIKPGGLSAALFLLLLA
jgi:hypothetical protein